MSIKIRIYNIHVLLAFKKTFVTIMATLIYSEKCKKCVDVIDYIRENPALQQYVTYHHVSKGVPSYVKSVPALVASDSTMYVGKDGIIQYLSSFIQPTIKRTNLTSMKMTSIGNKSVINGNYSSIGHAGRVYTPNLTKDLKQKIERSIEDGLSELKR
jgi:hypothetical protein